MKIHPPSKSAFFNPRVIIIGLAFCSICLLLALLAFALYPGGKTLAQGPNWEQPGVQAIDQQTSQGEDAPAIIGTCDTAGPIEIEATAGTIGPTAYPDLAGAIAAIN